MDQLQFDEVAFDANADSTPVELRSKFPLQRLPPQSVVYPGPDRNRFWTVTGIEGVMAPTSPDSDLAVRNVSQSNDFPNGTRALVPAGYKEFLKMNEGWKRIRKAGEGGVNIIVFGELVGVPGFGDFRMVRHPDQFAGGGRIQTQLPEVKLGIPVSPLAIDGVFDSSETPAFEDNINLPNKLSILVEAMVDGGTIMTDRCNQFNSRTDGNPITRGQLAKYAAVAVTNLMVQARGKRAILCINGVEIESEDLLLVKLVQISQGSLRAEIAVRDFRLPQM